MNPSTLIHKMVGEKKRWREYKARVRLLPAGYREAVEGIERYLMYVGPADGDRAATMFEDRADLLAQSAADQTPGRSVVGDEPVECVEAFLRNYAGGGWITRERTRLIRSIDEAAADSPTG